MKVKHSHMYYRAQTLGTLHFNANFVIDIYLTNHALLSQYKNI